ncbi:hypothetical protein L228DRAFT_271045 [Xylona heveae TC161]|uniref:DUF967 domain protein n=1 Tax=Xylona heveae (strain CBS 132557 / TC161) TaxID=1328760 RepID=A0A164ZZ05_XYLHT|nr:hypothetical protein L228DRAFT_271045 [Xylona heveae TC161]KZF19725.1 hypothetical protein L228DRAFT_271045 [Xylona heveae TC161]
MSTFTLRDPPNDLTTILSIENKLQLPSFTSDTAFELGSLIRSRLRESFARPAIVSITHANSDQLLFHAVSKPGPAGPGTVVGGAGTVGTAPDNDIWAARKRRTVLRFGTSTWYMRAKCGTEEAFKAKFALGERAGDYAIHGGGFPVRVRGVEGLVGVIVVSGLKMEEDHQVIVQCLEEYLGESAV